MNMSTYFIIFIVVILLMLREREIRPAKLIIIPLFMLWGGRSFHPAVIFSLAAEYRGLPYCWQQACSRIRIGN
ncbi:hypothetical protein NL443_01095 [Bacillus nakamurai]|nr:hypothetical protein [Bacillus nakamurai]